MLLPKAALDCAMGFGTRPRDLRVPGTGLEISSCDDDPRDGDGIAGSCMGWCWVGGWVCWGGDCCLSGGELTASRVIRFNVDLSMEAVPEAFAVSLDRFPARLDKNEIAVKNRLRYVP